MDNLNNIKKLCRESPASLVASAAEEQWKDGTSRRDGKTSERHERSKLQARSESDRHRSSSSSYYAPSSRTHSQGVRRQAITSTSRRDDEKRRKPQSSDSKHVSEKSEKKKWTTRFSFPLPELGQPGGLDDPLRKGMNGATTRKYLVLLHEGKKPEEAKKAAMSHINEKVSNADGPSGEKRGSDQITPPHRPLEKKPRLDTNQVRSYANAAKGTKVAVLAKEHPAKILTNEELGEIEDALITELLLAKVDESINFDGIFFRSGMLQVNCNNDTTVEWVKKVAPKLSQWKGPELMTCVGDEIPRDHVITLFLPRSQGREDSALLQLLENQNKDLNIPSWKILKTKNEGEGVLMNLGIDDQSCENICKKQHKLHYRFGTIPVYGLKKKPDEENFVPPDLEVASTVSSLGDRMADLDMERGETSTGQKLPTLSEEEEEHLLKDVEMEGEEVLAVAESCNKPASKVSSPEKVLNPAPL